MKQKAVAATMWSKDVTSCNNRHGNNSIVMVNSYRAEQIKILKMWEINI